MAERQPEPGELTDGLVRALRLGSPRTQRAVVVVLGVLAAVCVAATLTRLSALPLIPLPALGLAGYGSYRARRAAHERSLLRWSGFTLVCTLGGLWLFSLVNRLL